eukprot:Amastigsp_a525031_2.p2 type:complete len:126 gc:universal Amastigsp_a525031_2:716-339(-)
MPRCNKVAKNYRAKSCEVHQHKRNDVGVFVRLPNQLTDRIQNTDKDHFRGITTRNKMCISGQVPRFAPTRLEQLAGDAINRREEENNQTSCNHKHPESWPHGVRSVEVSCKLPSARGRLLTQVSE